MKQKTNFMAFAAMLGLTATVSAGNFNINTHLGSFPGGSTDAVKANVDYDGAGPLPAGVYVIKPRTDDNDWYLPDIVFVEEGATLIIEPGTTIYADSDDKGTEDKDDDTYGAIVVARGGAILAEGTPTQPIVITSVAERDGLKAGPNTGQQPVPGRDGGLWGGVVLLGRAPLTTRDGANGNIIRETIIEGFASTTGDPRVLYGPGAGQAQPEESSGVLAYMSLRFGGYEFSNGNEINGLTMGAVGRGTRVEFIEVVSNTDDAFEWFGGTVNCRNLVAVFCNDDNLDMDLGFQGTVQNVLIVQNNVPGGQGADNGFELSGVTGSSSTGTGPLAADATKPVMFNVTSIGNGEENSTAIRTNSGFSGQIHNSVFLNYDRGVRLDDALTAGLVDPAGNLKFTNNTWVTPRLPNVGQTAAALKLYEGDYGSGATNDEVDFISDLGFKGAGLPYPASGTFNPTLTPGSPLWAHNGATISKVSDIADLLTDNQRKDLQELPYRGAFGTTNWAAGWTYLSAKGFFDETPVVASGPDVNIMSLVAPNDAVKANVDYDGAGPLPAGVLHLTADKTYYLPDILFVENGATLIIDPGTVIYCDSDKGLDPDNKDDDTYGAILVARGGKMIAEGSPFAPIIMTAVAERDGLPTGHPFAGQPPLAGRDGGLWGGLVLLGKAPLTTRDGANGNIIRENVIEGFAATTNDPRVLYGPGAGQAQPEESSGVLAYMSLRFGGYEFSNGNEINGLTMGAVGRGSRIEYIEVVSNTDDAFEWFGGTVNSRNLVAVFCNDDHLDMDLGFQGTVQSVLVMQNNLPNSQGSDNGFELSGVTGSSGTGTGPLPADATKPIMFNVTAIGSGAENNTAIRTNSGFSGQIHNTVFLNYDRGVRLDDALTAGLVAPTGNLKFTNNTWVTPTTLTSGQNAQALKLYEGDYGSGPTNNEVDAIADLLFAGAAIGLPGTGSFGVTLQYASPLWGYNGASLTDISEINELSNDNQRHNLVKLPYQGAFGIANWADGWTYLTEQGFFPGQVTPPTDDYDDFAASFVPPLGARGADDDNDGLSNGFEYLYGLDPTNGASVNPITVPLNAANGTFTYTRRNPALSKANHIIETSVNLSGWTVDAGAVQTVVSTSGNVQTVSVQTTAAPVNGKLFVRVGAQ
jgi:trimeric autotransporter adhesin